MRNSGIVQKSTHVGIIRHELMHGDSVSSYVLQHQHLWNFSRMTHLGRAELSCAVQGLSSLQNWLNILNLIFDQVITLEKKLCFHAHSSGTTLTVPAAVS